MDDLMLHGLKDNPHGFVQEPVGIAYSTWIETVPLGNCQLFMKHLVYLGNVFHIEDGIITITPH